MDLVFANFSTDRARWPRVRQRFASAGLAFTDELDDCARADAKFVLNKTRYIDAAWLAQFRSLEAVVVLGREDWMVDPDADVPTFRLDVDRGYEVAEHALTLMLAGLKRMHRLKSWRYQFAPRSVYGWFLSRRASESQGAHNWTRIETATLQGARVGILGYGQIGRQIHRRLAGFDAHVFYHNRRPYPVHVEQRLGIRHLPLDQLFAMCDAVFVQTPLCELTRGLVSRTVLAGCRRGMLLVNCGRACVIDQTALTEALADGRVGFYGSDVFWREPMPLFTRFRFSKKCLFTPHMAESLPGRQFDLFDRAIRIIQQFQGAPTHAAA